MSLELFQIAFGELLLFSLQQGANRWLIDVANMPPLGLDEQAWLSELWLPCARHLSLRHMALVLPADTHNQLIVDHVINDGRQYFSANVQFFSDTVMALDWLTGSAKLMLDLEQEWQAAHVMHLQARRQVA